MKNLLLNLKGCTAESEIIVIKFCTDYKVAAAHIVKARLGLCDAFHSKHEARRLGLLKDICLQHNTNNGNNIRSYRVEAFILCRTEKWWEKHFGNFLFRLNIWIMAVWDNHIQFENYFAISSMLRIRTLSVSQLRHENHIFYGICTVKEREKNIWMVLIILAKFK